MKYHGRDTGNCRHYYQDTFKGKRFLYCWQDEGREGWKFYRCSQDGEPSHEVKHPNQPPAPKEV